MKISDGLKDIQYLYIETAPLIYYIEENPNYLAKMDAIIAAVETIPLNAISSVISLTEVLAHPLKQGNTQLEQQYHDILLNNTEFSLLPVTRQIAQAAAQLCATYNLRFWCLMN